MKQIFRVTDCKFEEVDALLLKYTKPCAKGHQDQQGRGVRFIHSGSCIACKYKMPDGAFAHDFGDTVQPKRVVKIYSDEEGRKRHIARVIQWQKDNPEKFKAVQKKYSEKDDRREINRLASRERYYANKEFYDNKQKEYYYKNKEKLLAAKREAYAKAMQIVAQYDQA